LIQHAYVTHLYNTFNEVTSLMRILHVLNSLDRGGTQNMLMTLYRRINRSRLQFDFLVHTDRVGGYEDEIRLLGGHVYRIPGAPQTDPPSLLPGPSTLLPGHTDYVTKLREFFHGLPLFHYPVVHSHLGLLSGTVLAEAEDAGVPVRIAHSHTKKTAGKPLSRLYKYLWGPFIRRHATHLAACSREGARWLFGRGARRAHVIPDAMNVRDFVYRDDRRQRLRRLYHWQDSYVIGYIGRLEAVKNPEFLLRVFARLHSRRHDAILVFIGCGSQAKALKSLASELRLTPYVRFFGERNDIPELINALDILAVPSLAEGLGTAVVEAQANGLPCFVSTGVPRSADMGAGLVHFMPLLEEVWCDHLRQPPQRRPTAWHHVVDQGYDAYDVVDKITDFYTRAVKYGL